MDIAVTVFATNIFGNSQATDPILISKWHTIVIATMMAINLVLK